MQAIDSFLKKYGEDAIKWLLGALLGLFLAKACDVIWPDDPVVVKEVADTVKVVHTITPLPSETDSLIREQIERQLLNLEMINIYNKSAKSFVASHEVIPCKVISGNSYPNSKGYALKNSSSFCIIEANENNPFIDITYRFIREDYVSLISSLGIKIEKETAEGNRVIVLDQSFEPQKGEEQLVRIVNNLSPGEYWVRAGFILEEDKNLKYPGFYSQLLKIEKR